VIDPTPENATQVSFQTIATAFSNPFGITGTGNALYVADPWSNTIIELPFSGSRRTLAGNGVDGYRDGNTTAAQFSFHRGVWTDGTDIYIVEGGNSTIRKLNIATGNVTTVAGMAGIRDYVNGRGTAARFNIPSGIWGDGVYLYVADTFNHAIRKV